MGSCAPTQAMAAQPAHRRGGGGEGNAAAAAPPPAKLGRREKQKVRWRHAPHTSSHHWKIQPRSSAQPWKQPVDCDRCRVAIFKILFTTPLTQLLCPSMQQAAPGRKKAPAKQPDTKGARNRGAASDPLQVPGPPCRSSSSPL